MVAACAAPLASLAMAVATQLPAPKDSEPSTMSGLRVDGLAGYSVHDAVGLRIGEISDIETDHEGRTRYLRIRLDDGREARLSAFRAHLDEAGDRVDLMMPLYAVERTIDASPNAAPVVTAAREETRGLAITASLTQ